MRAGLGGVEIAADGAGAHPLARRRRIASASGSISVSRRLSMASAARCAERWPSPGSRASSRTSRSISTEGHQNGSLNPGGSGRPPVSLPISSCM